MMDVKDKQVVSDVEGEETSSCPNGDVKPLVTSNDVANTKSPTSSHSPEMKEIVKEKEEKDEDTKIRVNNATTKSKKELEVAKKLKDVKDEESTEEEDGDSTEEENSNDFSDDDDDGG